MSLQQLFAFVLIFEKLQLFEFMLLIVSWPRRLT